MGELSEFNTGVLALSAELWLASWNLAQSEEDGQDFAGIGSAWAAPCSWKVHHGHKLASIGCLGQFVGKGLSR